MEYRVDFGGLPWIHPMPGVRAKTMRQGPRQLRLVEYTPEMDPHWCEKGHYGCILEGEFEIRFDGGLRLFHGGDGVHIPAGAAHRHMARALTPVVRALFVEDLGDS